MNTKPNAPARIYTTASAYDVQPIIHIIREKERVLHNCLNCSQVSHLLRELLPLLGVLKGYDYESYRVECERLAKGMFSFVKSKVLTTMRRYALKINAAWDDLGLAELQDDLLEAETLLYDIHDFELSEECRAELRGYSLSLMKEIEKVKKSRKEVLSLRRRDRMRYYFLGGPGKALLIALGFILLFLLVKSFY
jgi:hypothetical protein